MATKKATSKLEKKEVKHVTPELIMDVLTGKYGPEGKRNPKLLQAGYNPGAVTKKINDLKKLLPELKTVQEKAGKYYDALLELGK